MTKIATMPRTPPTPAPLGKPWLSDISTGSVRIGGADVGADIGADVDVTVTTTGESDVGVDGVSVSIEVSKSVEVDAGAVAVAVTMDVTSAVDMGVGAATVAVTIIVLGTEEKELTSDAMANTKNKPMYYGFFRDT